MDYDKLLEIIEKFLDFIVRLSADRWFALGVSAAIMLIPAIVLTYQIVRIRQLNNLTQQNTIGDRSTMRDGSLYCDNIKWNSLYKLKR